MPRAARLVEPGSPHHICQRGNNRQEIFKEDKDRIRYLNLLEESADRYSLRILAYCLMDNHIHMVVIPNDAYSLLKTFRKLNTTYSHYFNRKYLKDGHLWKERYFSAVLDSHHLISAVRYIERNPIRAGLVKNIENWRWSTAGEHLGYKNASTLKIDDFFKYCEINKKQWANYVNQKDLSSDLKIFRYKQRQPR